MQANRFFTVPASIHQTCYRMNFQAVKKKRPFELNRRDFILQSVLPRFFLIAGFCVRVGTDRLQWSIGVQEIRMSKETVTGICGICPGGCGVNVVLIDGKVDKIVPLKGHPIGVVCVRGVHSQEIVYSRDRLKSPLLRVGEKGEGKFERITWVEATEIGRAHV